MLRLRPYKAQDARYVADWICGPVEFSKWCANRLEYPLTEKGLQELQTRIENDEKAWLFTALEPQGVPVGFFMMRKADYTSNSVHLGFIVINPRHRGKGYGKEMLVLALRYAFDILGMDRITLRAFGNNEAARRCYKGLGFVDEGCDRDFEFAPGQWWECYSMVLTHERWRSSQAD